jgi:predicted ATPase
MTVRMLLRKVKLENLFSFRNAEVELRELNVLIGANASGKSNLIEAISLLQEAPQDLSRAILRQGGVHVVCSLAVASPIAAIECNGINAESLQYRLEFSEEARGFIILKESLSNLTQGTENRSDVTYFERSAGTVRFGPAPSHGAIDLEVNSVSPTQSVFELYKTPKDPTPISRTGRALEAIQIYREFRSARGSLARNGVVLSSPPNWNKSLADGGDNLALVLLDMDFTGLHDRTRAYLRRFCDRFNDVKVRLDGSIARTYIEESGLLEPLVSWRLSDGTLKFLCLLAVLLDPNPAPLICIEEPEVGLHPEAIQIVAEALVEASERTQLIVTTHSEALIDALSERPEDVLITERDADNGTQFRRLDKQQLSLWLERYSLGRLWRMGEIGGTRW